MARSYNDNTTRYGIESTPGVAVPTTKCFPAAALHLTKTSEGKRLRRSGAFADSLVYQVNKRSEGTLEGAEDFAVLGDAFALTHGAATTTELEPDVAYRHVFTFQKNRPTWTVEQGPTDAGEGERVVGVFARGYTFSFTPNTGEATLSVNLEGGAVEEGRTLGVAPTPEVPRPLLSENIRVFVDNDLSSIGTTEVFVFSGTITVGDLRSLVKLSGNKGEAIATPLDATVQIVLPVGLDSRELADGARKYIRVEVPGGAVPGSLTEDETLIIDTCCQNETDTNGEESALYAQTVNLRFIEDESGFCQRVEVVNGVA